MIFKTSTFKTIMALSLTAVFFLASANDSLAQNKRRKRMQNDETTTEDTSSLATRTKTGAYGTAGCGLGSMAFGNQEGLIQVVAATLNGTSGSQTFGISTGTSNCDVGSNSNASLQNYIEANTIALEKDVSRGNGPSIQGLAQILGCESSQTLGSTLQKNYSSIFNGATADKTATQIKNLVEVTPALQNGCKVRS